ncbi:MAG: 30S ribosomal protein S6 [Patescibacteria group bacterium]
MLYYEFLFILPGTLSEDEVKSSVDKVKTILINSGVEDVEIEDLGKNRLAYPIKHIRYGYFQICRFQTDAEKIVEVQNKLRLTDEILRFLLQKYDPKKQKKIRIDYINDEMSGGTRAQREIKREVIPLEAALMAKNIKMAKPETKETEKVSLEDIDRQLDEILGNDISGV